MSNSGAITGKSIAAFWSRVAFGTRMTCLDNTFHSHRATGVVTKPGKTSLRLTTWEGRHFWLNPPKRVSDVIALTHDTITYRIGNDHHTATWRIDPPRPNDHDGLDGLWDQLEAIEATDQPRPTTTEELSQ